MIRTTCCDAHDLVRQAFERNGAAMPKLYHPTIPGKVREVRDAEVDAWVESGWRKTAPKTDEPKGDGKK